VGKTAREFCKERDYTAGRLLWWSSDLKRRGIVEPRESSVVLTRVTRKPEVQLQALAVVVHLGGVRIEVPPGADKATVSTVLEVLSARAEARGRR
jgi:hypothetical protein